MNATIATETPSRVRCTDWLAIMNTPTTDQLHKAILHAMETETRRIVEEEAKNAAARVEERVRAQAGQIATKVASYVSYEAMRNEVRITVRLPERDNG